MKEQEATQCSGVVLCFNVSPKGFYEGLLIKSDKHDGTVQLNFPPDAGAAVARLVAVGDRVTATAVAEEADHRPFDHAVLKLISITSASGRTIAPSGPDDARPIRIKRKVMRLNYARHGEPNGAVMDNGDFVHLKPHGAKAVKLQVGQSLDVKGRGWPMLACGNVIEAESVNGIELPAHKKEKHGAKHHKHAETHS